ncbi:transposase [Enterococcus faecalis]|uniref:transposase n=1 Tax=Enterococcus faecalis TaxID=1351 RepID=UPI00191C19BE|nr:transposase [Enterococcus faecalis]
MLEINSPLLSIPGISYRLGSVILAEIGDIDNFKNPSKLLAFCGLDPSIYESGNYSGEGRMVKRGSKYLRWAMMQAARLVAIHCETFQHYLHKKINEGKHYFVALSHAAKKLNRLIFYLLKNDCEFDMAKSV